MNNFILTYNPFSVSPTAGQLLNHVQVNRFISQYYQPYAGTYLLKSDQSLSVVNESVAGLFEGSSYMLVHYAAGLSSGALPKEIWAWINFGSVPVPPPPSPKGLLDF